ncbi:888_t:CDS:2 [Funneliformis caledonium]|uniref:888_t:CDS:1 n=1 Tax=Funneliformis caledonium TaxID=1117310 RepID=A0A9N9GUH1_9GLOM|nr:888_t:CDS:2 [Funneliformis caledonium]
MMLELLGFMQLSTDVRTPENTLLCNEIKVWQGHAILFFNNAKFETTDFEFLIKIRVSGKQRDETKFGKTWTSSILLDDSDKTFRRILTELDAPTRDVDVFTFEDVELPREYDNEY